MFRPFLIGMTRYGWQSHGCYTSISRQNLGLFNNDFILSRAILHNIN